MSRNSIELRKVNKIIGNQIKNLRIARGLSRTALASKIDVSHQQLEKYEIGSNRIAAGRLINIAQVLNKPISYFFSDLADIKLREDTPRERLMLEITKSIMTVENPRFIEAIKYLLKIFKTLK